MLVVITEAPGWWPAKKFGSWNGGKECIQNKYPFIKIWLCLNQSNTVLQVHSSTMLTIKISKQHA